MRRKKRQATKQPVSSGNKSDKETSKTEEVLIDLGSGTENSASGKETTIKKGKTAQRPPAGESYKRPRVLKESDMDEDFATSPFPSSPSSSASIESSTRKSPNAIDRPQPQLGANPEHLDDLFGLDQVDQQRAPISQNSNPSSPVSNHAINTNTSRHGKSDDDVDEAMENDDDDILDVTKFRAATPLSDVKKDGETKKQMI